MIVSRLVSPRPARAATTALLLLGTMAAACSTGTPSPTAVVSSAPSGTPSPIPATPSPTPSPAPTPRYTNEPDAALAALIPTEARGVAIVVAPFDEFALTPGDVAIAFGEVGDRFSALVLAYVPDPRTSLYAMRVDGDPVTTEELEPHLATAGRYVGIAGLHREPWTLEAVGGSVVWTRPEDNATALGTHIYTWASDDLVFLLIGTDDTINRAIIEQLPGEPAPTPTPTPIPSGTGQPAPSSDPSASPEG